MEVFAIFLSVPVAFVANVLYCLFLAKVVIKSEDWSRLLRRCSWIVLSLFAVELVLLVTIGAARSRGILGPGFYLAHLAFFVLGPPALDNLLVLRPRGVTSRWYVASVLGTVLAFFLVLLQYSVSEALYGIDGEGGPYSSLRNSNVPSSQLEGRPAACLSH